MNINRVGITRVIPKAENLSKPYRDIAELGCDEIRERFFKDGSRILMGYVDRQKTSTVTQKISYNPYRYALEKRIRFIDIYGENNEQKEISIEKCWYNRIGDILKSSHLIKTYEKNKLVETQSINFDINSGFDTAKATYTKDSKKFQENNISSIEKQRFSPDEYLLKITDSNGNIREETRRIINEDVLWKYE